MAQSVVISESGSSNPTEEIMTQNKTNLELAQDMYRSMDAHDFARVEDIVSPRFQAKMGGQPLDFPSWKAVGSMFFTAFPDGRHVFELMESAGDYVLSHGHFTGTHKAEFHGLPATGKVVKCSLTMIDHFVDGKLVRHYGDFDSAGLMQQLTG
jgi:predicted ester cyclase